jgi:glutamine cyclotransferase
MPPPRAKLGGILTVDKHRAIGPRWAVVFSRTFHLVLAPLVCVLAAVLTLLTGCDSKPPASASPAAAVAPAPKIYGYQIVNTFPHDRAAFTQGLVFLDGALLETTGLNGQSSLRRVELETGRVLRRVNLPQQFFGEGMTVLGQKIYQVTWQNRQGFVYDLGTLAAERTFRYDGEGWGLTTDGRALILSDGTDTLRWLDPATFQVARTVHVTNAGRPQALLNELEWVKAEIWANVWQTDTVARIDPATGRVTGIIDFSGLLAPADRTGEVDVLNGIAHDAAGDRLFVTGKNWPKLFEVRLVPK